MDIRDILIAYKSGHAGAADLADQIDAWLAQRGICARISEAGEKLNSQPRPDLAVVLGGDGTILGVARHFVGTGIPVLGINFGRVGFLTAAAAQEWQAGLELALAGRLKRRACLALAWRHLSAGAAVDSGVAINDVVVARGCLARLTTLGLAINGTNLSDVRSDGLIISSPLGSSGYYASAGGSVMHPDLEAIGIVAICPFMADPAPLVMPQTAVFTITVEEGSGDCYLTIDGQLGYELKTQDQVIVSGLPCAIHFLGRDAGFLERLRSRGRSITGNGRLDDGI